MSERTAQKKAVVTDGDCPAGFACARLLRQRGYSVLTGCDGENMGEGTFPLSWKRTGAEAAVGSAIQTLGGIDLLVCTLPEIGALRLTQTEPEELDWHFLRQYRTTLMAMKAAALRMTEQKRGSIVLMTGTEGLRAKKSDYLCGSLYAGLHRTMQSFALQLAPYGVRINAVASGGMEGLSWEVANRLPMGRLGRWEESAEVMRFLAEEASYLTGAVLPCDGGLSLAGMPENNSGYGWDMEQRYTENLAESGGKAGE